MQAVEVTTTSPHGSAPRTHKFTFCLERIDQGPYQGCWLTYGVRVGDYANV